MKKIILPIFVIMASIALLIFNFITSEEFDRGFWFRTLSSILLIVAMIVTIISKLKNSNID